VFMMAVLMMAVLVMAVMVMVIWLCFRAGISLQPQQV
jgi:uncharacterized membrane protein YqjE